MPEATLSETLGSTDTRGVLFIMCASFLIRKGGLGVAVEITKIVK